MHPYRPVSFRYTIYGLRIESDRPLPGVINLTNDAPVDVRIEFKDTGERPKADPASVRLSYQSQYRDENDNPNLMFWDSTTEPGYARFLYADGSEFVIDDGGTRVRVYWPTSATTANAISYLVGPILGYVLRLRGEVVLHASAVVIDNGVVAFVGPSHSGKSTLTAAFAHAGFPAFSDDQVAVGDKEGVLIAQPGYPRLRLWSTSASVIQIPHEHLPQIAPEEDKRFLDLTTGRYRFHSAPLPLRVIYILGARSTKESPKTGIEPLGEKNAMLQLIANTYVNYLLSPEQRRIEFEALAHIVRKIPVRTLTSPGNLSELPEFCATILADLKETTKFR